MQPSNSIFAGRSFESIPATYFARINFLPQGLPGGILLTAGGSIITNRHILCAAHTLQQGNIIINVYVGGNTRQTQRRLTVNQTLQHPDYNHQSRVNDIGLIITTTTIIFNLSTRPVVLPSDDSVELPYEGIQGQVLGFGGTANNQQQGSSELE